MNHPFEAWLRALNTSHNGPVTLPAATRGRSWSYTFAIAGNLTGATLRGQVRAAPDAPGDPLATFVVGGPELVEDRSLFKLSLTSAATGLMPADDDGDGIETFVFELLLDDGDGNNGLLFGGVIPVLGRVTE